MIEEMFSHTGDDRGDVLSPLPMIEEMPGLVRPVV
jgi:hypothetical protein